jgi:deoxyadenosine/deoxycytidine kinase
MFKLYVPTIFIGLPIIIYISLRIISFCLHKINNIIKKNIVIGIEGNIGVGKTTFLDNLKSIMSVEKATFISEPVDEWLSITDDEGKNILAKFYEDKRKYAFQFQINSYTTKMRKLARALHQMTLSTKKIIFTDRSIGTDKNVFAKMLYDDKLLDTLEYKMYIERSNVCEEFIINNKNTNIIYLRCDPTVAYNRIQKRGRTEEKMIPLEYLKSLHEYHEKWINSEIEKGSNVLVLDWDADLEEDKIVDEIKKHINKFINSCHRSWIEKILFKLL